MLKPLWLGAVMVFVLVLTLVALNPLSSPTCDWWEGLAFLFLGPVISALGFSGVGLYLHRQHPSRAHVAAAGVSGVLIGYEVVHFLVEPAVFGFSPLYGYFAGPIYDANIEIGVPYLLTRAAFISLVGSILIGALSPTSPLLKRFLLVWSGVLCAALISSPPGWGISGKQRVVEYHLDTQVDTGPLIIRARVRTPAEEHHLKLFVQDAQQRFEELEDYFGFRPQHPLRIYLYPSVETQRKWMGAGRVRVAKPWRSEIHIPRLPLRDPVVKHEMAHVFAGELSDSLLRVPSNWGILPNMALIEGPATRVEERRGERLAPVGGGP